MFSPPPSIPVGCCIGQICWCDLIFTISLMSCICVHEMTSVTEQITLYDQQYPMFFTHKIVQFHWKLTMFSCSMFEVTKDFHVALYITVKITLHVKCFLTINEN